MGIRFQCPNGHRLNVKDHLAGKRGICPDCGAKFVIPSASPTNGTQPAPAAETTAVLSMPAGSATFPVVVDSPSAVIRVEPLSVSSLASPPPPSSTPTPDLMAVQPGPRPVAPDTALSTAPPRASANLDFSAIPSLAQSSPVAGYAANRQRTHRTQVRIAVALLLVVVILAVILIWVLNRGPAPASTPATLHLAKSVPGTYFGEPSRQQKYILRDG